MKNIVWYRYNFTFTDCNVSESGPARSGESVPFSKSDALHVYAIEKVKQAPIKTADLTRYEYDPATKNTAVHTLIHEGSTETDQEA